MPNLYATAEELKARFGIGDNLEDTLVDSALDSASRAIDQHCQRIFYVTGSTTATFVAKDRYCLRPADTDVWVGDIVTVTSLKTDASGDGTFETTWAVTDYQLWPVNAASGPEARPYTEVRAVGAQTFPVPYAYSQQRVNRVQIVGTFGWPTAAPSAVREACLMLAAELFKLKDAPFGIAGMSEFGVVRIRENPKVATLLMPYQRYPVLVG
jgi:hypothetical protein